MAANVKIKLIIDDSGALQTLKEFNKTIQELAVSQKVVNKQFNKTFDDVGKKAKKARDNFKQLGFVARDGFKRTRDGAKKARKEVGLLGKAGSQIKNVFAGVFIADTLRQSIQSLKNLVVGAITVFLDFERGLVSVGKTAGIAGKELENLGDAIQNLDVPLSNKDLLGLATVAGQLGIKGTQNILKFTRVMADLQSATDIVGEQGAQAVARILNVTGEAIDTVDVFGSVLVRLGNNSAATESQILSMANEVSRSTAEFEVSSTTVLGVSATLASLGARAEGSGTAVGKVFRKMSSSIAEGGRELRNFANIMGTTEGEFTKLFESNPTEAFIRFTEALGLNAKAGTKINTQLAAVGLNTDRMAKVLPVLSTRIDIFREKMFLANEEAKTNTALTSEAATAYDTLGSDIDKAKKSISSLGEELVKSISPQLRDMATAVKDASDRIRRSLLDINKASISDLQTSLKSFTKDIEAGQEKILDFEKKFGKSRTITRKAEAEINDLITDRAKVLAQLKARGVDVTITSNSKEVLENEQRGLRAWMKEQAVLKEQAAAADAARTEEQRKLESAEEEKKRIEEQNRMQKKILELAQIQIQADVLETDRQKVLADERIQFLQEQIGTEAALIIGAQAEALRRQGKFAEAQILIDKKVAESKLKLETQKVKFAELSGKEQLKQTNETFGLLAQAAAGGGKRFFEITKKLQVAQAITSGILAVQRAYETVPYPFNIVNAAAQAAIAANNVSRINNQQAPSFEQGGIVPGTSFSGDNVQANVNSGEMILNRQQQSNLFKQVNTPGGEGNKEIVVHTNVQIDEETIFKAVSRQVANGAELGEQT
jgi:TP901 family phage tail tape measure protein